MILFLETEEVPLDAERTHQQVPVMPFPSPRLWVPSDDGAGDVQEGDFSGTSRLKESLSSGMSWVKAGKPSTFLGSAGQGWGGSWELMTRFGSQGRQEGDLAEKGGEWIAFVIALVSADLSVTSDVREKRHFANSGKVLYTEFIAGSTNLWVSGAKWKDRPLVCKLLRISRRQQ